MDAQYHARSSARKWGGCEADYLPIHEWLDASSAHIDDQRHRAMRHHSMGVHACIEHFGRMLRLSNGKDIPVKQIAERHCVEDLGFVPSVADWVRGIRLAPWMTRRHIKRRVF